MAKENIIGAVQLPMNALKKVLPNEGDTVVLGEEQHTKIEYRGKSYLIHWSPAIHIMAVGDLEAIEKEIDNATEVHQQGVARRAAAEALRTRFNELVATPVTGD